MAMPRKIKVEFGEAFPYDALTVGEGEPMRDFDKSTRDKPVYAVDEGTGLPIWTIDVLDADPSVSKTARSLSVRILAKHQPTLPKLSSGTPTHLAFMRPVEFEGLTASPYVVDSPMGGGKGRLAWSFRCMKAPEIGGSTQSGTSSAQARPSGKASTEKAAA